MLVVTRGRQFLIDSRDKRKHNEVNVSNAFESYTFRGIRRFFTAPTGRMLSRWFRSGSMSEPFSLSQEQEDLELEESLNDLLPTDITRFSFMSNDSGIERDLPAGAEPPSSLEATSLSTSWEHCKR